MDVKRIAEWNLFDDYRGRLLIAGPCSAENPEQVIASCIGAAQCGAHLLRAGIWKPRTHPDSFQGVGKIGLPWIKKASQITGKPVAIEVAKAVHVEQALKHDIDVLWIGARTTTNPFAVQEIADALVDTDIPVLIKNPINPDIELWIGALQRIHRAGIDRIALIHRGFSVYKSAPYRNLPMWQIPIEVKRRFPNIEIICDPSHIAGRRDLLPDIAQKASDLNFDGFMIECHNNPDAAWSDAAQQVTAEGLRDLLANLIKRHPDSDNPDFHIHLESLRNRIDDLDRQIIRHMADRMAISKEIGKFKKDNNVTILQMNRWAEIFDSRVQNTIDAGLSEVFAKEFMQSIHNESIRQQTEVMN